ncbi:MAG: hypothetical protein Q8M66_00175 [Actinomycetota bacterium]|nr:hypothetical protein [Actinomycetota bacterium]
METKNKNTKTKKSLTEKIENFIHVVKVGKEVIFQNPVMLLIFRLGYFLAPIIICILLFQINSGRLLYTIVFVVWLLIHMLRTAYLIGKAFIELEDENGEK